MQAYAPPHVFEDEVSLKLIALDDDCGNPPDMSPFTKPFRASILARARFIEDLVLEQVSCGVDQYVLLGAGLDSFAQRKPDLASQLRIFELDQSEPQEWKRQRLLAAGFGIADHLKLVPVDLDAGDNWLERLVVSNFYDKRPTVVTSTGVSMYLTKDAIISTLRQIATFAPGSTFVMPFLCPVKMLESEIRIGVERAAEGARASGTHWISFFKPDEIVTLAHEAGFDEVQYVSATALAGRYFAGRSDGLRPPNNSEELLVATA
ncbi:S-adenosyl-L-methionine-dependent methyltransferase [Candidatus Methylobacter favarea]|uniref:S-adenosyl-L-methionine-dependent methyltransferase n=1 Tax=Candidatus Methylobacter favarea TaxID=2707345 RepID=A0A8S0W8R8_9GAMM|nr:S-adenosyl-L-methionine-dependent methyltransferase [Candidatus Methylobacter favarea]